MAKAQVGDLIRIVNPCDGEAYKIGEIYEVIYVHDVVDDSNSDVHIKHGDGGELLVLCDEYEIHRKSGEEDSPNLLDTVHAECQRIVDEQDAVNSPNHYTQGRFETIEIIEGITQGYDDGFVSYNIGNVLKYIARAPHKHDTPLEDLRKAERYLRYAIDRITQK